MLRANARSGSLETTGNNVARLSPKQYITAIIVVFYNYHMAAKMLYYGQL
ncbi:hypothetical protein FIBSPDRAFT_969604 [Athelia psychrophila]|uniref:Uncharacterized protein n=1 Tax=Athelia psychrophila TaxID=1759441 RepID=A0A167TCP0_9AGAM|nr:hypothetical protein FIBSPDRAFT_969604 [Fibularhizoctonia sp. CBS 109695]